MPIAVSVDVLTVDELGPAVSAHFGSQRLFTSGPPPDSSGAYVWSSDPAVLYIGSAASQAGRLPEVDRGVRPGIRLGSKRRAHAQGSPSGRAVGHDFEPRPGKGVGA